MIAVEEENEYYESDEWYFEDPDADYLQRVRYQIAYNKDEIRNFEESQIQEGLSVADGKVQKYRQDGCLRPGYEFLRPGLSQVQQQMYDRISAWLICGKPANNGRGYKNRSAQLTQ